MKHILVVEDDEALRMLICDLLMIEGYEAISASNGLEALEILKDQSFDLTLSDINMPEMGGFEFLEIVAKKYPQMQRILMTAYNVDDYIELILKHKVGNTIVKSTPFDATELLRTVKNLLSRDIFGLARHMEEGTRIDRNIVRKPSEIDELCNALALIYGSEKKFQKFRTVFVELVTNAVFYGARRHNSEDRETWPKDFVLSDEDAIEVFHARDSEKIGVAVVDNVGRLDQETVLYWLNRQITPGDTGLPQGVFDTHGRGFYITRKYVDRLIINVERQKRCESLILDYFEGTPAKFKPVMINEL